MDSCRKTSECEEELSMINRTGNDIAATTVDTANIVSMTPGPHQHPPPSPLSGCYLLVVLPEPHSAQHKHFILNKLTEGFLSWDKENCHVDLEKELEALVTQSPEGEEAKNGERLIQYATENLVTEILIHPQTNTLLQCIRNLLASFTKHRHIIHAGYTFGENGSWILQDGTFSLADFLDAFNEHDVQRVLRAYENNVTIDINCAGIGEWSTERLSQEPCTRLCRIRLNPDNVLTTGIPAIVSFINYIEQYLVAQTLDQLMQPSDVVGNIRFSHPTLYVFPGGQGDAALFGINGFNMLVDGGFARKSCFWDFTRHLDRLDAVLFTRLNNSNIGGMSSVLRKKKETQVYPQIGHFFGNLIERKHSNFPDDNKDRDPLIISLIDLGQEMLNNLKHINLRPHLCYRNQEPINLYHKVGHGTLDMYILSPLKDSTEVKEFLSKWNAADQKLFADSHKKDSNNFTFPIQNMVSICALLIWQPANPDDSITRILFPGSTPQHKIFEGIDRLKHLEFLKYPTCSAKNLSPAVSLASFKEKSTKLKINQIDKETKRTNEIKNPKRELSEVKALKLDNQAQKYETKAKKTNDLENKKIDDTKEYSKTVIDIKESKKNEKNIKDSKKDSKKDVSKEAEIIKTNVEDKNIMNKELKGKIERKKHDSKDSKESKITPQVLKVENKSDSTNKKLKISTSKKPLSGLTTKSEISKSPAPKTSNKLTTKQVFPPAKSAKDANNRKVLEQKNIEKISSKQKASPTVAPVEKKSVVRRTKLIASPSKSRLSGSPVKQSKISSTVSTKSDKDVVKKIKNEKETTDSSTVSTSSVVEIDPTKFVDKCLTEKSEDMSLDSIENKVLADLKEERQVIEEIEAVLQKAERIENTRESLVKEGHENLDIKEKKEDITEDDVTAEIDEIAIKSVSRKASPELTEEDEYLIIEKEEMYTEVSNHSGDTEHKHFLDVVQSEKNFVHESLIKEEEAENIILNKENDKEEKEEDDDDDDDDVDVDDDDGNDDDDDDDVDNQDYGDDDENELEKEEEDGEYEQKRRIKEIAEDYESVEKEVAVEKGIVEEQEKSDIPEKKLHDDFQDREKEHQESKSISISKHKEESEDKNKEIITSTTKIIPKKDGKDALDKKDSENKTEAIRASPEKVDSSERKVINDTDVKQEIGKDSQIREKFEESQERVSTMESGATTTAPTLPEDERISVEGVKQVPTDIIKQGIAEVKKIEISAKSRIISLATMEVSELKPGTKVITSQQTIPALPRDIVKTPDEVADLPVHEEVDPKLYEIDNYDTSKEGKAQYIKESVISSKEPKNVLGFFSKVADKFEKGIDKLTGKSRRDSEKDIDENSLSKSGSPRESVNIDEISAGMKIEEDLQPKQDGKNVAVKKTIETSIESKEIHKTEGIPSEKDEKSDTPEYQQANKFDEKVEGVEDVEALLEEASKKFKTVKDSLRDSLESLEEQIVQEELIKTELECDSNDEIAGKLNKVVEKLEEIKPNEENITTNKEIEKVKFGLSKSDDFEYNERSDDMSSVKNIKEAVKDVGEVLAGTAGIIIEDKPKDVIEIVKKVAEVLKGNDFLPDQTLSAEIKKDSETKESWQDHHDERPVASSSVKNKNDDKLEAKLMCADLLKDDKALNLQTDISALSDTQDTELDVLKVGIESVCKKVDVTHQKYGKELVSDIVTSEIAFEHKIIPTTAEVVVVTPDSLPPSPQFSAILPDQYVDKSPIEMSSIESFITEDVKNIVNKKVDIYKIIEELLLIHKIKITIQILEFISIEKQIVKQKLIQIINQIVSQHNLLPSSAIENITIFDTEKEILRDVKEQEVEDYINEKYIKNNIPITVMILKDISIKHSYPIYLVIKVIKNIIIINKVPQSNIIDISEQVLEDLVRENTQTIDVEVDEKNQINDNKKHDIQFTESTSITDEVKSQIQDHFTNEYIARNKSIDVNAIERIHQQYLIPKRAIMEILDEIIISKKLQKQSVVDIAEVAWSTFESSDEIEVISKNIKKDKRIIKIERDPSIDASDKSKYPISIGDLEKSESDDFEAVEQEYKLNTSIDKNKIQHHEKECSKSSIDDVMEADEKINMNGQKPENMTDKNSDLTATTSSMKSSTYGQKIIVESENDNEQELKSSTCLESIVMSDKITLPDFGKDLIEDGKSVSSFDHTSIKKQDEIQTNQGEVQDSHDSVLLLSVKSSRKTSLTEPEEKGRDNTESLITSINISPRQAEKSIDLEESQIQSSEQPLSPAHSVSGDSKNVLKDIKDENKDFALTSSSTAISPTQKKDIEFSKISEVQNIELPIAPIVSNIDKKMNDQIDNQGDDKKPESSEIFEFSKGFEKNENLSQSSNKFELSTSLIASEQQRPSDQTDDHDNNVKSETLLISKSLSSATDMIDDNKNKSKDTKASSIVQLSVELGGIESVDENIEDKKNIHETIATSQDSTSIRRERLTDDQGENKQSDTEVTPPTSSVNTKEDISSDETKDQTIKEESRKRSISKLPLDDIHTADNDAHGLQDENASLTFQLTELSDKKLGLNQQKITEEEDIKTSELLPSSTTSQVGFSSNIKVIEQDDDGFTISEKKESKIDAAEDRTYKVELGTLSSSTLQSSSADEAYDTHDELKDVKLLPKLQSLILSQETTSMSKYTEDGKDSTQTAMLSPNTVIQTESFTTNKDEKQLCDNELISLAFSVCGEENISPDDVDASATSKKPLLSPSQRSDTDIADSNKDVSKIIEPSPESKSSIPSNETIKASMHAEDHKDVTKSTVSPQDTTSQHETLKDMENRHSMERQSLLSLVSDEKDRLINQPDKIDDVEKSKTLLLSPSSRSPTNITDSHEDKSQDVKLSPTLLSSVVSDETAEASKHAEDHRDTIESAVSIPDTTTEHETLTDDEKEKEQYDERRSSLSRSVSSRKGSSIYQTDNLGDIEKSETPLLSPSSRSYTSIADSHEDKSKEIKLSPTLPSSAVSGETVKTSMQAEERRDTIESTVSIPDTTTEHETSIDDKKEKELYDERRSSLLTSVPSRKGSSIDQTDNLGDIEKSETFSVLTLLSGELADKTKSIGQDIESKKKATGAIEYQKSLTIEKKSLADDKNEIEKYDTGLTSRSPILSKSLINQIDDFGSEALQTSTVLSSTITEAGDHSDDSKDVKSFSSLASSVFPDRTQNLSQQTEDKKDNLPNMSLSQTTTLTEKEFAKSNIDTEEHDDKNLATPTSSKNYISDNCESGIPQIDIMPIKKLSLIDDEVNVLRENKLLSSPMSSDPTVENKMKNQISDIAQDIHLTSLQSVKTGIKDGVDKLSEQNVPRPLELTLSNIRDTAVDRADKKDDIIKLSSSSIGTPLSMKIEISGSDSDKIYETELLTTQESIKLDKKESLVDDSENVQDNVRSLTSTTPSLVRKESLINDSINIISSVSIEVESKISSPLEIETLSKVGLSKTTIADDSQSSEQQNKKDENSLLNQDKLRSSHDDEYGINMPSETNNLKDIHEKTTSQSHQNIELDRSDGESEAMLVKKEDIEKYIMSEYVERHKIIVSEVLKEIMNLYDVSKDIIIEIIEAICYKKNIDKKSIFDDGENIEFDINHRVTKRGIQSSTLPMDKKLDIENYIIREYVKPQKKITLKIIQEISTTKGVSNNDILAIVENLIAEQKLEREFLIEDVEKDESSYEEKFSEHLSGKSTPECKSFECLTSQALFDDNKYESQFQKSFPRDLTEMRTTHITTLIHKSSSGPSTQIDPPDSFSRSLVTDLDIKNTENCFISGGKIIVETTTIEHKSEPVEMIYDNSLKEQNVIVKDEISIVKPMSENQATIDTTDVKRDSIEQKKKDEEKKTFDSNKESDLKKEEIHEVDEIKQKESKDIAQSYKHHLGMRISGEKSGRSTPEKKDGLENRSRTSTPEGFRSEEVIKTTITTTRTISDEGEIITTTKEVTETTNEHGEVIVLAEKVDVTVADQGSSVNESASVESAQPLDLQKSSSSCSDVTSHDQTVTDISHKSEEKQLDSENKIPDSPASMTSQVYHFEIQSKPVEFSTADMSSSFYGHLPSIPPSSQGDSSIKLVSSNETGDFTFKKLTESDTRNEKPNLKQDTDVEKSDDELVKTGEIDEEKKDPLKDWGTPMKLPPPERPDRFNFRNSALLRAANISLNSPEFDLFHDWGKPMELPSPAPVCNESSDKTLSSTPKKDIKQPKKIISESLKNKKRSESPSKSNKKSKEVKNKIQPVYLDLTFVPHHGNSYYTSLEFFKRIRARYYVFSGTEPSREVYDALLNAKKTWENKDLEVTIIPTYDTDTLGYWVADNEEALAENHIDLSPSASRCTINLQDHETSCSAYRLEF